MEGANMKIEFYTSTEIENIKEVIEHIKKTNIRMYDVGAYRVINLNGSTFTILITSLWRDYVIKVFAVFL